MPDSVRRILISVALASALVALGLWAGGKSRQRRNFTSCRNHATFVSWALNEHVHRHGSLPFVNGTTGEIAFCRLDFQEGYQNCHAGAPGQSHGGWQMVNAPEEVWDSILQSVHGLVPVAWCGRVHVARGELQRIVICIVNRPGWSSFAEFVADHPSNNDLFFGIEHIEYGMPENELRQRVQDINACLEAASLPELSMDVVGQPSYEDLAKPFQTPWPH